AINGELTAITHQKGEELMQHDRLAVCGVAALLIVALPAMASDVHHASFQSASGGYTALCTFREAVGVKGIRFRSSAEYDACIDACREESREQRERKLIAALQKVAKFIAEHPDSEPAIRAEGALKAAGYR